QNDVTLKMPAFEWVHVQLHQQKGMISLSPPTICNSAVHSMDRLARNLDDLRRIVQTLTQRGVHIEFVKEHLSFTGEDSPMANLMLSVMGAFAEFERALIRERQREGIALAKQRGAYRGRKKSLSSERIAELRQRVEAGEQKTKLAREFGISRETLYQYLRTDQ
ncbi:recombinase family protein, partial [Salmonella enterica subsp. enterica serovar Enteritidis]|nr:recombinase family protein [Salmonella enterica subsp. enterica serovar Enteritidis]MDL3011887.1 recombinase family protein [Salmonella enterica]